MADTIPDVAVTPNAYVSLNSLSGIIAGTAILVTNKGTSPVRLQIAAAQPSDGDTGGELMMVLPANTAIKSIPAGESEVWAMTIGYVDMPVSVQDNT